MQGQRVRERPTRPLAGPLSVAVVSFRVIADPPHGRAGLHQLACSKEVGQHVSASLLDAAPAPDAVSARRFRGKNKGQRWKRGEGTELAVIRLPLDVHRLEDLPRVENLYSAMWSVKRA